MMRLFFLLIPSLFLSFLNAKPIYLTPQDVQFKCEQLLHNHVLYKEIDKNLAQRVIENFIDQLDPAKLYFLEDDLEKWLQPTDHQLNTVISAFKTRDFSFFEEIYKAMLQAIERRKSMNVNLLTTALQEEPKPLHIDKISWCKSQEELFDRLLQLRSIQCRAAKKLSDETKDLFLKRVEKRRLYKENLFIGENKKAQKSQLLSLLIKAFASSLDSHTAYFTASEASQFMIEVQQRVVGIGAQLKDNLNGFSVASIVEHSPAYKSKMLKINDLIIAVDKTPVVGMDITEAVDLIRGEKNTPVLLTILRESRDDNGDKKEEKLEIEITRGEIVLEESRYQSSYQPYGDGVIGYLKLYSFYQDKEHSSAKDLRQEIDKLKQKYNLKGIVLDLRNNSGGLFPQAVSVTGLFISKGIVASIKDSDEKLHHYRVTDSSIAWDGPLIVLTNQASASASEIVAQTLQDYGRAIIIGDTKTFGKGTFQSCTLDITQNKVHPKGELKVTKGIYYTVSGKSPQLEGVKTDVVVPGIFHNSEIGECNTKYALAADKIEDHFDDDLSDLPEFQRKRLALFYRHNLQSRISTYTQYLPLLIKNSKKRIKQNSLYQNFLKDLQEENFESSSFEAFEQNDLQKREAFHVMQDLIFLTETSNAYAACY